MFNNSKVAALRGRLTVRAQGRMGQCRSRPIHLDQP